MKRSATFIAWKMLLVAICCCFCPWLAQADDVDQLAAKIDREIEKQIQQESITATLEADDYEFLRRVSLDLIGRIPSVSEVHRFVADQRPDKRKQLVDELLERPRHALHLAHIWRDWLVPELSTVSQARYFEPGFEAWLSNRFHERTGYDQIVL
jgi:hypothetical protein